MSHRYVRLVLVGIALTVGSLMLWAGLEGFGSPEPAGPITPYMALATLKAGNARYVASARTLSTDTRRDGECRQQLVKGQHPVAAILCCADSRIVPEFIFDQQIGSLFDIRNAGNVVDDDVLASLEYAIEHLHIAVILVMGHKGCGAIEAVYNAGDRPLPPHLGALQERMAELRPEIRQAHGNSGPAFLNHLAEANARQQAVRLLQESELIREAVRKGQLAVVVGQYDIEKGEVAFKERVPLP
jgi:carbonic anhydrase